MIDFLRGINPPEGTPGLAPRADTAASSNLTPDANWFASAQTLVDGPHRACGLAATAAVDEPLTAEEAAFSAQFFPPMH